MNTQAFFRIKNQLNREAKARVSGFSLVELMITLVLTSYLLIGVLSLYSNVSGSHYLIGNLSEMQENGRFAMNFLAQGVRGSGFFGNLADIEDQVIPAPPTGNETDCQKNWIWRLSEPILGYDQTDYSPTSQWLSCISNNDPTSDMLVLRMSSTEPIPQAELVENKDYLYSNLFIGELIREGENNTTLSAAAEYWGIKGVVLYVKDNNKGIPSLYQYDSYTESSEELVEGIEKIQFSYGIKSSTGPFIIDYNTTANEVTDWSLVGVIQIELISRSVYPDSNYQIDGKCRGQSQVYQLSNDQYIPKDIFPDCYRRRVFTSIVQLRNLYKE